jgi:hypothetical protein
MMSVYFRWLMHSQFISHQPGHHLYELTFVFTALVFFSATQGEEITIPGGLHV